MHVPLAMVCGRRGGRATENLIMMFGFLSATPVQPLLVAVAVAIIVVVGSGGCGDSGGSNNGNDSIGCSNNHKAIILAMLLSKQHMIIITVFIPTT